MAEAVSGYEVTEQGTLVRLDDQMKKLNDLRERVKEAPKGKPTAASFTRWFFSEPWERTISPTSSSTVDQYIASRLDDIQRRRNKAIEMRRDSSTRRAWRRTVLDGTPLSPGWKWIVTEARSNALSPVIRPSRTNPDPSNPIAGRRHWRRTRIISTGYYDDP